MLTIDIRNLEEGYHEFSLTCDAEDLELGRENQSEDLSDIRAIVRLHFDGKEIVATVEASATASLVCDRTLVNFDQDISGTYSVLFSPDGMDDEGDVSGQDEVRPLLETDEQIDVTDIVRDTLLLAIPVRKIAPGAEDAEIQTAYGVPADGAVDPRWDALADLKQSAAGTGGNGNRRADAESGRPSAT